MALKSGIGLKITLFQTLLLIITIGIMSYVSLSSLNELSSISFHKFKTHLVKEKTSNHKNNLTQLSSALNKDMTTIDNLCTSIGKLSQEMLDDKKSYMVKLNKDQFSLQDKTGRLSNNKNSNVNVFYSEDQFNKSGYSSEDILEYRGLFSFLDKQVAAVANSFPYIESGWIITASTLEIHYPNLNTSESLPHASKHSIQNYPVFKQLSKNEVIPAKASWSTSIYSSSEGKFQTSVCYPLYENGKLFGAIGFNIGLKELSEIIEPQSLLEGFNIILNKDNQVIYNSSNIDMKNFLPVGLKLNSESESYVPSKNTSEFTYIFNNEKFNCLKKEIPSTSWTLIHVLPGKKISNSIDTASENFSGLQNQLKNTYLTLTAVLIFLAIFMSHYLLKFFIFIPLNNINKRLIDIREGKYDAQLLESSSDDELSQIALSFNAMSKKLRENNDSILSHRHMLEKEVEERTHKIKAEKEEAIAANRSKSQFLANMSHEIRTPMNAILGFTQLLDRKLEDPKMLAYLNSITDSGNILLRLIDDILDISKVEAGKLVLRYKSVNIHQICYSLDTMFGSLAREKGLNFDVMIDEQLPKCLKLDEIRIRQVITNLLSNAIKFTERGKVELNIKALKRRPKYIDLHISVNDTGCGVSEREKEKIFGAFEQVSGQQQKEFGGTGLGLSISKSLVELMNGHIECKSEESKGSKFSVTLKNVAILETTYSQDHINETVSIPNLNGKVILVAEDISFNRDLIESYLQETGATLIFASDGIETIEKYKMVNPDLILMDLKMPKMGGIQAASIIQNLQSLKKVPIIFITASAMIDEYEQNKILCDSLLSKPVKRNELIEEIKKLLSVDETYISESKILEKNILLEEKINLITGNELLNLLSTDTKELQNKAMKSLQLSHIQDFYDAMMNIADSYNNDLINDFMHEFKNNFNNYDMKNVETQLSHFDELLDKLIASHQN